MVRIRCVQVLNADTLSTGLVVPDGAIDNGSSSCPVCTALRRSSLSLVVFGASAVEPAMPDTLVLLLLPAEARACDGRCACHAHDIGQYLICQTQMPPISSVQVANMRRSNKAVSRALAESKVEEQHLKVIGTLLFHLVRHLRMQHTLPQYCVVHRLCHPGHLARWPGLSLQTCLRLA